MIEGRRAGDASTAESLFASLCSHYENQRLSKLDQPPFAKGSPKLIEVHLMVSLLYCTKRLDWRLYVAASISLVTE